MPKTTAKRVRTMLKLYDILRAAKAKISPDIWTSLAAKKLFGADFEPTFDSDYICSGNRIIYYKGSCRRPAIPQTIGGAKVQVIGSTAFGGTGVEAVKIPEGVEVIG